MKVTYLHLSITDKQLKLKTSNVLCQVRGNCQVYLLQSLATDSSVSPHVNSVLLSASCLALLGDLGAVRGPVLVRVGLALGLVLLCFQGDGLGAGDGCSLAAGRLGGGGGGGMGGAFGFQGASIRLVLFLRGGGVVRALLPPAGTWEEKNHVVSTEKYSSLVNNLTRIL